MNERDKLARTDKPLEELYRDHPEYYVRTTYTEEEIEMFREEDQFTPELAERYRKWMNEYPLKDAIENLLDPTLPEVMEEIVEGKLDRWNRRRDLLVEKWERLRADAHPIKVVAGE